MSIDYIVIDDGELNMDARKKIYIYISISIRVKK
jgi:hypothetical protein